jgi:2-methylcitrate dehydratase PrpD
LKVTKHQTTLTSKLSDYFLHLDYESLSKRVIEEAKLCILDTLGCILAGASIEVMPNLVKEFSEKSHLYDATVVGYGYKTSIFSAGLLNGTMGHAVEMDDVHKKAKVHPGTVVIPALLGYGEWSHSSGKEIILATAVGYEAMNRIGMAINATTHRLQGWHSTGTCGTFGSAAALAKLLAFSKDQFVSALGLAGTQSSGLWAFTSDGADCKMFHAGHAVTSGITAVNLVKAGMRGSSQILEAEDGGLFKASSRDYNFDVVTEGLGENLTITEVSRKPYACCRSMHPSIDAALTIKQQNNLDVEEPVQKAPNFV